MENNGQQHDGNDYKFDVSRGQKGAFKTLFNKYKGEVKLEFEKIQSEIEAIKEFKEEYLDGTNNTLSVKASIDDSYSKIVAKSKEISLKHEEIIELYDELFNGTKTTDAIKDAIVELVSNSKKLSKNV